MKNILYTIWGIICISISAYGQNYYWYGNQKIPLTPAKHFFVMCKKSNIDIKNNSIEWHEARTYMSNTREKFVFGIIDSTQYKKMSKSNITYIIPTYKKESNIKETYLSHLFYVKLKRSQDFALLQQYARQNKVDIEYNSEYLPRWYVLSCVNSEHNALEMANLFYESGLFEASEPDMWNENDALCVNDTYFTSQWNLENTGQYGNAYDGLDIHYCDAHSIVPAQSNIIIAILDQGIQLNHPDLAANIFGTGYDTDSHSSPSVVSGNHGTACAGIIGAISNNNIGVSGIAFNCKLMSISNTLNGTYASRYNRAEGIIYAANHNADVISNSWGSSEQLTVIDDAISYALDYGRNGKGSVVVFSSGNDNVDVKYPANSNANILTVGAMSPCGERKSPSSCDGEYWWGSNYGNQIDVVAPGVNIMTTDRTGIDGYNSEGDYTENFNGTSSACPHVSGIAGLVLSVNPYLSHQQVAGIIESTAQKVGSYTYQYSTEHPSGKWNNEMGYGLVDAYAAVTAAKAAYIVGPDYVCDTTEYHFIRPLEPGETISWSASSGSWQSPTYSIIGPTNQATVTVVKTTAGPIRQTDATSSRSIDPFISATVSNGATSNTYQKTFRSPHGQIPTLTMSSSAYVWPSGTSRTFTISNCTDVDADDLQWTVKKRVVFTNGLPIQTTTTNYTGRTLTYTATSLPSSTTTVTITATSMTKECGENSISKTFAVSRTLSLMAVKEGDQLNVTLPEIGENYTLELWDNIYGKIKSQAVGSTSEMMSIHGLSQGVYLLLLKDGDEIVAQAKVFIQ